jgi:hypothetical protein
MNPESPHPNPDELGEQAPDDHREIEVPREVDLKILNIGTVESF